MKNVNSVRLQINLHICMLILFCELSGVSIIRENICLSQPEQLGVDCGSNCENEGIHSYNPHSNILGSDSVQALKWNYLILGLERLHIDRFVTNHLSL